MKLMQPQQRLILSLIFSVFASGCATTAAGVKHPPQDPWESWNRGVYKFNDAIDRGVAKPVARAYVHVIPKPVRTGVGNFFANLETPTVMVNDALQGKLRASANDLGRFVLNTTLGIGGLLDPASRVGLDLNDADFGQTLGVWGVHAGPFVEIPLLGPSDLRDVSGKVVDEYSNPRHYVKNTTVKYSLAALAFLNLRAELLPFDDTLKNVYDPYAFIRDAYLQRRAFKITGKAQEEPLIDPDADVPGDAAKPAAGSEKPPGPTPPK